jgi:NADH:ubiquinone oxidoreductase subunit K
MVGISLVLVGLGFSALLYHRSFLGSLLGVQVMGSGLTTFLLMTQVGHEGSTRAEVFALGLLMLTFLQSVIGFSMMIRLFQIRGNVTWSRLRKLRF